METKENKNSKEDLTEISEEFSSESTIDSEQDSTESEIDCDCSQCNGQTCQNEDKDW